MAAFLFVTVGWLLFKFSDFGHLVQFISCLIHPMTSGVGGAKPVLLGIGLLSLPVMAYHAMELVPKFGTWVRRFDDVVYGSMLAAIIVAQGLPGSFIYFQF